MKVLIKYLLAVFFLGNSVMFSQSLQKAQEDLIQRLEENRVLMEKDPERAFKDAKNIEKEASKINAKEEELRAIENQFIYYKISNDLERMLVIGQSLYQKATAYKIPIYQAIAKKVLFDVYLSNNLPERALLELDEGKKNLNKIQNRDTLTIKTKANYYISYANYYAHKRDYLNDLKYLKLAGSEIEKYTDFEGRQNGLYVNYSNLAQTYLKLEKFDSAGYYANLSLLADKKYKSAFFESENLRVLGEITMQENNYEKALSYFKEAKKQNGYKDVSNISLLYDNIILSYQRLQQEDSVRLYRAKKDSLKLSITENQNKSLHKLLEEQGENIYAKYFYVLVLLLVLMLVLTVLTVRKNKLLVRQEKISERYLKEYREVKLTDEKTLSKLVEMLKSNDPAYMATFGLVFPEFIDKLRTVDPKIVQTEVEFCTMMKLNLMTKEIARILNIEPKSVQVKKYRIRKKLNIPNDVDIYMWFNQL